jgi:hypothetical protein
MMRMMWALRGRPPSQLLAYLQRDAAGSMQRAMKHTHGAAVSMRRALQLWEQPRTSQPFVEEVFSTDVAAIKKQFVTSSSMLYGVGGMWGFAMAWVPRFEGGGDARRPRRGGAGGSGGLALSVLVEGGKCLKPAYWVVDVKVDVTVGAARFALDHPAFVLEVNASADSGWYCVVDDLLQQPGLESLQDWDCSGSTPFKVQVSITPV